MDTQVLENKFVKMGARIEFEDKRRRRWRFGQNQKPVIDVRLVEGKETFIIDLFENKNIDVQVLDLKPDRRHLLLMLREEVGNNKFDISKFLCGHDERHWFVAAIPEDAHAKNVEDAMTALKPEIATSAQNRAGVKGKHKHKRKNKGYIRQGEWFFIPESITVKDMLVFKNEPISRGRGSKPHICEELFRSGGETVYVHRDHAPNGMTQKEFDSHIKANPKHRDPLWRKMTRGATAYARGYVRHSDHKTIYLNGWHRIEMNMESKARAMATVVFLD